LEVRSTQRQIFAATSYPFQALAGFNVSAEDETDFDEDASQAGSDPSVPNEEGQGGSKLDGAMDELTDTLYEVLHNSALRAGHEPRGVAEFVRWIFRDLLSVIRAPDVAAAFDIQALLSPLSEEQRAAALSAGSRLLSADGEAEAGAEGELPPLQLQREPPPDADAALQPLLESFKKQFSLALQQIGKAALEPPPPAAAAAADAASAAAAGAQSEVVFLEVSHGEADSATLAANGYERISAVANKEATAALGGSALWVKRRNRCVGVPSARGSPSAVPPVAGIALSTLPRGRARSQFPAAAGWACVARPLCPKTSAASLWYRRAGCSSEGGLTDLRFVERADGGKAATEATEALTVLSDVNLVESSSRLGRLGSRMGSMVTAPLGSMVGTNRGAFRDEMFLALRFSEAKTPGAARALRTSGA